MIPVEVIPVGVTQAWYFVVRARASRSVCV